MAEEDVKKGGGWLRIFLVVALVLAAFYTYETWSDQRAASQIREATQAARVAAPARLERALYQRPDEVALEKIIDESVAGIRQSKSWKDALPWVEQAQAVMDEVDTMYSLSEFFVDCDIRDEEAYDEYLYCWQLYRTSNRWWSDVYYAIKNSDHSDMLLSLWYPWEESDELRNYNSYLTDAKEAEIEQLSQQALDILNDATVFYNGEEITLEDTDYMWEWKEPYSLWLATHGPELLEIYTDMARAGSSLARDGYRLDSYSEYLFHEYQRRYSPADAQNLVDDILTYFLPLDDALTEAGYWSVMREDYMQREDYLDEVEQTVAALDAMQEEGAIASIMTLLRDYDLWESDDDWYVLRRPYTIYLPLYRIPIMLCSYSDDVQSALNFLHEFGHFYEFCQKKDDYSYCDDLSELHSQGFALLFVQQHGEELLIEQALVDEVDTLVYQSWNAAIELAVFDLSEEELTPERVKTIARESVLRFGYEGTDAMVDYSWLTDSEMFTDPLQPFCYVSSGAVALELWELSREDMPRALEVYEGFVQRTWGESLLGNAYGSSLGSPFVTGWAEEKAQLLWEHLELDAKLEAAA